jgi:parallel beta-helix repeat protein
VFHEIFKGENNCSQREKHHLVKQGIFLIILSMLVIGAVAPIFSLRLARADTGMIFIRSNGSIDPPTSNITSLDNVTYTFTGNIKSQVTIERSNITVDGSGNTLQGDGSGNGFYWTNLDNVTVKNTTIDNFAVGIYLNSSSNNSLIGNKITANELYGLLLVFTSTNKVEANDITNNQNGIWLDFTNDSSITANNITNNYYGMGAESYSNGNSIYHNNFISNIQQVPVDQSSKNVWDNGYPDGGNYWSTLNATDQFNGPYQNVTGSDALADKPFVIDQNNTDNYPLIYTWPPRVSVSKLTSFKTVIGQGYTSSISVFYENLGNQVEVFNATIYANSTLIDSDQTTLNLTNRYFSLNTVWNTTGFSYGNYTLTATAQLDPSDKGTTNNSTTSVIVTIPGDINGKYSVDLTDLVILANSYGSGPNSGRWNANADIDDNGVVGLTDLTLLAVHYAQHV